MEKDEKLKNQDLETVNGGFEDDHAYYRYMFGVKYKCNSCGHVWEASTKPTECEECHSTDIEKD